MMSFMPSRIRKVHKFDEGITPRDFDDVLLSVRRVHRNLEVIYNTVTLHLIAIFARDPERGPCGYFHAVNPAKLL